MTFIVTGDQYQQIDAKLSELRRQMRNKNGCNIDPQMLMDVLQNFAETKSMTQCFYGNPYSQAPFLLPLRKLNLGRELLAILAGTYQMHDASHLTTLTESELNELALSHSDEGQAGEIACIKRCLVEHGLKLKEEIPYE
jgi:hypothetical protein